MWIPKAKSIRHQLPITKAYLFLRSRPSKVKNTRRITHASRGAAGLMHNFCIGTDRRAIEKSSVRLPDCGRTQGRAPRGSQAGSSWPHGPRTRCRGRFN
jgi:hypothetical protein